MPARPEKAIIKKIEAETHRVVADHQPTIYALQGWASAQNDFPYTKYGVGLKNMCDQIAASPDQVDQHIRSFFSRVDTTIDDAGKKINSPNEIIATLKLFLRQLYTVASIESHVKAVEAGAVAARKRAGGKSEKVLLYEAKGLSGGVFQKDLALIPAGRRPEVPLGEIPDWERGQYKVILVVDDVAHSGENMSLNLLRVRNVFPKTPVIISVGVVTTRALECIHTDNRFDKTGDQIIWQEKRLSLGEMIAKVEPEPKRQALLDLAYEYFGRQSHGTEFALKATHIITPFKLPDRTSNGPLSRVCAHLNDDGVTFAMHEVQSKKNSLYPSSF